MGTQFSTVLATDTDPEIRDGTFTEPVDDSLLSALSMVEDQSCSSDSDCPATQCVGDDFYVDEDGDGECVYDEVYGDVCGGYDKVYGSAEICGGRYNYGCDESGDCLGFKEACKQENPCNYDCKQQYDFCDEDDDSGSSGGSDDTTGQTDACREFLTKCDGNTVVECQDTDGDGYTDGFVTVEECANGCENAECQPGQVTRWFPTEDGTDCTAASVAADVTEGYETEQACLDSLAEDSDDTAGQDRSLGERIDDAVLGTVRSLWNTLTGWI